MSKVSSANIIKGILIDFLIDFYSEGDVLFASELFFGSKKRKADILLVNGTTTGFEIKSKNDDFRRTREQLDDYKKVFDFQYLVITENHEKSASAILTDNEGLIVINDDNKIILHRKPKRIKQNDKSEILETIPLWYLKKHFWVSSKLKRSKDIRNYLFKCSLDELKECLRSFLKFKLIDRNHTFYQERGTYTHFEDIRLLESMYDWIV